MTELFHRPMQPPLKAAKSEAGAVLPRADSMPSPMPSPANSGARTSGNGVPQASEDVALQLGTIDALLTLLIRSGSAAPADSPAARRGHDAASLQTWHTQQPPLSKRFCPSMITVMCSLTPIAT